MFTRRSLYKQHFVDVIIASFVLLFFCELVIYYFVLISCEWPDLKPERADTFVDPPKPGERPVHAMFIADTHLLGPRKGHWFDKLRREWQMYITFQTVMKLHKPDIIFVLGDVFDEGLWSSSAEFDTYVQRFYSLFAVPENSHLYVVAGNHDIGFHYEITSFLNGRFMKEMNAPSIKRVTIRGIHFVLLNSMALEGDGCFLCRPVEIALNRFARNLKCVRSFGSNCSEKNAIKRYSRPVLLQHYPMYRESDSSCSELDEAPAYIKNIKFRESWECLSKEATEQLLNVLNPRLIVDGHTHHGCRKLHGKDILEVTIPSFNWRNKNNPSFLMGVITTDNYALSKCYMPVESTVITMYIIGGICIILYVIFRIKQRFNRHHSTKRY